LATADFFSSFSNYTLLHAYSVSLSQCHWTDAAVRWLLLQHRAYFRDGAVVREGGGLTWVWLLLGEMHARRYANE